MVVGRSVMPELSPLQICDSIDRLLKSPLAPLLKELNPVSVWWRLCVISSPFTPFITTFSFRTLLLLKNLSSKSIFLYCLFLLVCMHRSVYS